MEEEILITRATLNDVPVVMGLLAAQFEDHHIPFTTSELESAVRSIISNSRLGFILLAIQAGVGIGAAVVSIAWTLEYAGATAWLDELFVVAEKREQGVGRMLVEKVMQTARKTGCRAVDLEVDKEHNRAENLYLRLGFKPLARSRWFKLLG